jgi:hypothetical protein
VQVDIESSRIDFALVDDSATGKAVGHAAASNKAKAKPQATVTRPAAAGKGKKSGGKGR